MIKYKDLALVWGDDEVFIISRLCEVTQEEYERNTKYFGIPKGRTETFLDLSNHESEMSRVEKVNNKYHELFR